MHRVWLPSGGILARSASEGIFWTSRIPSLALRASVRFLRWRLRREWLPSLPGCVPRPRRSLSLDPAEDSCSADAGDREHEGGGAHGDGLALGGVVDLGEALDEPALLLAPDLVERPAEVLEVLDPFEVADDDAAGV